MDALRESLVDFGQKVESDSRVLRAIFYDFMRPEVVEAGCRGDRDVPHAGGTLHHIGN